MRARLEVVDLADPLWFDKVLVRAKELVAIKYVPSQEALIEYDQYESMKKVCRDIYKVI